MPSSNRPAPPEDAWLETLAQDAPDHEWFHAECTPGYYNQEGRGRTNGAGAYPHGAYAFHELLRCWRTESIDEALRARKSTGDRAPRPELVTRRPEHGLEVQPGSPDVPARKTRASRRHRNRVHP